jgi:hypothetical protein
MQTIDEPELVKRVMDAYRQAAHDAFPAVAETPSAADVHWRADGTATVQPYKRNGTLDKYEWDGTNIRKAGEPIEMEDFDAALRKALRELELKYSKPKREHTARDRIGLSAHRPLQEAKAARASGCASH